jgi:hypothetical protein
MKIIPADKLLKNPDGSISLPDGKSVNPCAPAPITSAGAPGKIETIIKHECFIRNPDGSLSFPNGDAFSSGDVAKNDDGSIILNDDRIAWPCQSPSPEIK